MTEAMLFVGLLSYLGQVFYLLLSKTTTKMLTAASQSGGWVPETFKSFHYWQPGPRWRPLPWLANPGNPAMSPHMEGRKRTPSTMIKQQKEKGGTGEEKTLLSPRA